MRLSVKLGHGSALLRAAVSITLEQQDKDEALGRLASYYCTNPGINAQHLEGQGNVQQVDGTRIKWMWHAQLTDRNVRPGWLLVSHSSTWCGIWPMADHYNAH